MKDLLELEKCNIVILNDLKFKFVLKNEYICVKWNRMYRLRRGGSLGLDFWIILIFKGKVDWIYW